MFRSFHSLALAIALAAPLFVTPARAGIEACGNINIEANAQCKAEFGVDCKAHCTPVNFQAACHGKLEASCEGNCTAQLPSCEASCQGSCEGDCKVDPGSFNCEGDCKATCEGTCSGKCNADQNSAECEGSCKATCSSQCTTKCTGTPPSADCTAKCQGSCSGSCNAEANMDCQIACQASGEANCEAQLQGGCTAQCDSPDGAFFCDGSFVDNGGKLAECKAAIDAFIKAHVTAMASGSSSCTGNTCEAEGKASCKCSRIAPTDATNAGAFTIAGLAFAGIVARRRSRRS
jgi:hypothetical protein